MSKLIPQDHGGAMNRWEKGESGNVKGMPKGTLNTSTIIKQFLNTEFSADNIPEEFKNLKIKGKKMTMHQLIILAQAKKALKGDEKAYDRIIDRIEGKATQTVVADINQTTSIKNILDEAQKLEDLN
jgi:uncharacterized radical SAM superfamily protein